MEECSDILPFLAARTLKIKSGNTSDILPPTPALICKWNTNSYLLVIIFNNKILSYW